MQEISRYSDELWSLYGVVSRENVKTSDCKFRFNDSDGEALNDILRRIIYARINNDVPPFRKRIKPTYLREYGRKCRRFLHYVKRIHGDCDVSKLTQSDLDAYYAEIVDGGCDRPDYIGSLLNVVADFYHYRIHLDGLGLTWAPWGGRAINQVVQSRSSRVLENKTERIRPDIIEVLVSWSLKYVTLFSRDIFTARDELEALVREADRKQQLIEHLDVQRQRGARYEFLKAYLGGLALSGRGVPVWSGVRSSSRFAIHDGRALNGALVHLHVGLVRPGNENILLRHKGRALLHDHAREFGIEPGGLDAVVSVDPETGQSWRPGFDAKAVRHEQRMLQVACYILCAYLTGMRDSEVQAMRVGCVRATKSIDGIVERYLVESRVYKDRGDSGDIETWVTLEEVAHAVRVLEELSAPVRLHRGGDTLWRVLDHHNRRKEHIGTEIGLGLRAFCEHINVLAGKDLIPRNANGRVLAPIPRQFRRTIAWFIGNRPFGVVAGKLQFKHVSVASFEGYAGTSASGFPQEVEVERRLGQQDDILDYFDRRRRGELLTGPAKKRIESALDAVAAELGVLPGQVVDAKRARAMLASLSKTLHVGPLADCFFQAETALCLNGQASKTGPQIAVCAPTKCANACINERHLVAWQSALDRAESYLKNPRLSALQRRTLRDDAERYRAILKALNSAAAGRSSLRGSSRKTRKF